MDPLGQLDVRQAGLGLQARQQPQVRAVENDVPQTALGPTRLARVRSEEVAAAQVCCLELYPLQVHFSPITEGRSAVHEGEVQHQRVQR